MQTPVPPVLGADMRAMRRDLVQASDQQVLDVLRYVDRLADRSQADGLLAPLRDRLRALRPRRPLQVARLLVVPLDPLLVNPQAWRPGTPSMPRHAIPPMVGLIKAALPDMTHAIEQIGATPDGLDAEQSEDCGRILWAAAAEILRTSDAPPDWSAAGLPHTAFRDLALGATAVLSHAWDLLNLADPAVPSAELNGALTAMLAQAEPAGAMPWGMLLTVLLQRFPNAEAPHHAVAAKRANRDMREAAEAALAAAWAWIEKSAAAACSEKPGAAAETLRRQIGLLQELARDMSHRRRATALLTDLRIASTAQFERALDTLIANRLGALTKADSASDDAVNCLEEEFRALRSLDHECRRLGGGAALDAKLRAAVTVIASRKSMLAADRARLIEILQGPQAALRHMA